MVVETAVCTEDNVIPKEETLWVTDRSKWSEGQGCLVVSTIC